MLSGSAGKGNFIRRSRSLFAALVSVSDVINFRVGLVITPKRAFFSEVVVRAACTLTTTSCV